MKTFKLFTYMWIAFSILFFPACLGKETPTPEILPEIDVGDAGFISESPCGPPCFLGIVPGKSTVEDAKIELERAGILSACKIRAVYIACPTIPAFLDFDPTNMITVINFGLSNVTLSDVIAKYGSPDSWDLFLTEDESGHTTSHFTLKICYNLLNTELLLDFQEQTGDTYRYIAEPTTKVVTVFYYADPACAGPQDSLWHGYGEYQNP